MSEFTRVDLMCLGSAIGSNNTRLTTFKRIDSNDEPIGRASHFSKLKGIYPGLIYNGLVKLNGEEIETIKANTLEYTLRKAEGIEYAMLKLKHEAVETEILVGNQQKKEGADKSSILDLLAPIRRAYKSTNQLGRLGLEVRVLNYLRNGKGI